VQVFSDGVVEQFLSRFWTVRQHLFRHVTPIMHQQEGLELSEYFLLKHISEDNDSPSEIAEHLQIPAHGISRKLDNLQKQGLINRSLDPEDARKRILQITDQGRNTLSAAQKIMNREVNQMLSKLSSEELELLLKLLGKLSQI
jgi:DNA-binding MarR family transcriptional regulator